MNTPPIVVDHYSDLLCIWAHIAQQRVDKLRRSFGPRIEVRYHFTSIFGAVDHKMQTLWGTRGGYAGYAAHVRKTAEPFESVTLHPNLWRVNPPSSSMPVHLFLKAVQGVQAEGGLPQGAGIETGLTRFEALVAEFRSAFFEQAIDISDRSLQMGYAEKLGISPAQIQAQLDDGRAHAALEQDYKKGQELGLNCSPSLVLDGGRMRLCGNVSFTVMEANVAALLKATK